LKVISRPLLLPLPPPASAVGAGGRIFTANRFLSLAEAQREIATDWLTVLAKVMAGHL
jgi:hypothetical protein